MEETKNAFQKMIISFVKIYFGFNDDLIKLTIEAEGCGDSLEFSFNEKRKEVKI